MIKVNYSDYLNQIIFKLKLSYISIYQMFNFSCETSTLTLFLNGNPICFSSFRKFSEKQISCTLIPIKKTENKIEKKIIYKHCKKMCVIFRFFQFFKLILFAVFFLAIRCNLDLKINFL